MNTDELILRDIHLPDPVSWWPPAVGWWLVAVAVCGSIAVAVWWWRRRIALRTSPATLARADLARLQLIWAQDHDTQRLASELSTWLRRASMSLASREQAASLTGQRWEQYLNDAAGEPVFVAADARFITESPYRGGGGAAAGDSVDGERLLALCQQWLDAATRRMQRR